MIAVDGVVEVQRKKFACAKFELGGGPLVLPSARLAH
jgi:hypothetical protein